MPSKCAKTTWFHTVLECSGQYVFRVHHFSYVHRLEQDWAGCRLNCLNHVCIFRGPHVWYYNGIFWLLPDLTTFADVVISHSHFGFWRTVAPRISEKPKSKTFLLKTGGYPKNSMSTSLTKSNDLFQRPFPWVGPPMSGLPMRGPSHSDWVSWGPYKASVDNQEQWKLRSLSRAIHPWEKRWMPDMASTSSLRPDCGDCEVSSPSQMLIHKRVLNSHAASQGSPCCQKG